MGRKHIVQPIIAIKYEEDKDKHGHVVYFDECDVGFGTTKKTAYKNAAKNLREHSHKLDELAKEMKDEG